MKERKTHSPWSMALLPSASKNSLSSSHVPKVAKYALIFVSSKEASVKNPWFCKIFNCLRSSNVRNKRNEWQWEWSKNAKFLTVSLRLMKMGASAKQITFSVSYNSNKAIKITKVPGCPSVWIVEREESWLRVERQSGREPSHSAQ